MAKIQRQANLAICSTVILLLQTISAARIPFYPSPTPALDINTLPIITAAPSPDQVNRRLEKRTAIVNSCATGCIASAVTKSTECKLGDTACECQPLNANAIMWGAFNCIETACGAFVAEEAISAASAICTSIANGGGLPSSSAAPSHSGGGLDGNSGSGSSGNGNSGSGSSGSGASGSGNSGNNKPSLGTSSSSSSSGISSGAIAGVAIGAAAIIVIACAVLYYFWVQKKRHREITNANIASQVPAGNATPSMALTVPIPGAIGKPPAQITTSTTPVGTPHYPSSAPSASPYSSAMDTVSPISLGYPPVYPGTTELAGNGWHQQQQANLNAPSQGASVHDLHNLPQGFYEVHGQAIPPLQQQAMFDDSHTRNELHDQPTSNAVHEMPAKQGS